MSATEEPQKEKGSDAKEAYYVYGIVPADVQVASDVHGVGDPPASVEVVRQDGLAALVSKISTDKPLGTPEDLMAHQQVLDTAATGTPVLPLRFGAVISDADAVVEELLAPHRKEFLDALQELEGRAEFVVKGRYVQETILREVLEENPEAAELRETIKGTSEDETRDARIRLGELINNAIEAKREVDTDHVLERLEPYTVSVSMRGPSHEEDAVHVALLVDTNRQDEMEEALRELEKSWENRVTLRLLGPLAPFDFVVKTEA